MGHHHPVVVSRRLRDLPRPAQALLNMRARDVQFAARVVHPGHLAAAQCRSARLADRFGQTERALGHCVGGVVVALAVQQQSAADQGRGTQAVVAQRLGQALALFQ